MQFITLKYFPLVLCFFSWDFWAGEMISFVFIFEGKHRVHKRAEGESSHVCHCKYIGCKARGRWEVGAGPLSGRQQAVDTLVNGPFGWLIPPHIFHLKMSFGLDTQAHRSVPLVNVPKVSVSLSFKVQNSLFPRTEMVTPLTSPGIGSGHKSSWRLGVGGPRLSMCQQDAQLVFASKALALFSLRETHF